MGQSNVLKKVGQNIPLSKKVEDQLKKAILRKMYVPGERLPSEIELSNVFGVSRTSIREALRTLAGQGLVEISGRSGVFVKEIDMQQVVDPLAALLEVKCGDDSDLHLNEVRSLIEPTIAGLAAERRTEEHLANLKKSLDAMIQQESIPKRIVRYDIEFHQRLAVATGNPIIPVLMEPIFLLLKPFITENFALDQAHESAIQQHRRILGCLEKGDGDGAFQAMSEHMQTAMDHYRKRQL
jgi:GntR family transcriptional regulator, transcriptional repressor for pyruvate dehydrogenase complex